MFTSVFQDRSFLFHLTEHSPSLWLASPSNPRPSFSKCTQRDVTSVSFSLMTFHKKTIVYYSYCTSLARFWMVNLITSLTIQNLDTKCSVFRCPVSECWLYLVRCLGFDVRAFVFKERRFVDNFLTWRHSVTFLPVSFSVKLKLNKYMLTLVFSRFVSEAMVNRSLDLGLIAKETTMNYGHKFVFTHVLYEGVTKWYVRVG